MSTAWFVAVCLMVAPADGKSSVDVGSAHAAQAAKDSKKARNLPDAVYDAIQRFRRSSVRQREQLVPELVALYEQVPRDTRLEPKQQHRLLRVLQRRLRQAERTLRRRVAREKRAAKAQPSQDRSNLNEPSVAKTQSTAAHPGVLTQQLGAQGQAGGGGGGPGGPQGGQTAANAQQLIDLIRATISPESWAVNGGNSRIFYYSPLQVLVVTH
jgi:hypothetical protein